MRRCLAAQILGIHPPQDVDQLQNRWLVKDLGAEAVEADPESEAGAGPWDGTAGR